jgi:hypothetical protein
MLSGIFSGLNSLVDHENPTISFQSSLRTNLFDRQASASNPTLSSNTIAAIKAMLSMEMDKDSVALLLELAGCSIPHQRYLAGPIVTHNSGWQESIPRWLLAAIPGARFEAIAAEIEAGEIGTLATPEEALAVMYPATMQVPLSQRDRKQIAIAIDSTLKAQNPSFILRYRANNLATIGASFDSHATESSQRIAS